MPENPQPRRSLLRRFAPWLAAWVLLTTIATVLHWGAWIAPRQDPPIESFLSEGIFRYFGNLFGVMCTPGWFVLVRLIATGAKPLHPDWISTAIIVNGLSWIFWLTFLWMVLRVRRWLADEKATADAGTGAGASSALPESSRRRVIVNTLFAGGAIAAGGTLAHGTLVAPWQLRATRYRVPIKGLPPAFDGLRIGYVSDTHLGPRIPEGFVREAISQLAGLNPDLFLLGGDYVHNGPDQIVRAAKLFEVLVATGKPVIGVLGNHDWYAGGQESHAALRAAGVRTIDNGRVYLRADRTVADRPPQGPCLCIAGVGDLWTDLCDPRRALDGVRPDIVRLMLSHNPDVADYLELGPTGTCRVDLMLSGHTHGGQVVLPLIGTPVLPVANKSLSYGLLQGRGCRVLISSGVGMSMIPIRVNCPPEVVEITLVAA
ncbi:MAG: metallophosphoesterase [Phycisphaerales bacterium]